MIHNAIQWGLFMELDKVKHMQNQWVIQMLIVMELKYDDICLVQLPEVGPGTEMHIYCNSAKPLVL